VMVRTSPEGQELAKRPGEVVARVCVDCLEKTEGDPDVDCQNVKIASNGAVQEWAGDGALGEDEDLKWVGVLCSLYISIDLATPAMERSNVGEQ
jgi:hypothetical protein